MEYRYRYNGKELEEDFGLNWYNYGARMYDSAVGRFTGVDLLADSYAPFSPYSYVANNPLRFTDPTGQYIVDENGNKVTANVTQNDDGVYSATFTDSDGNEISADSDFGQNTGTIVNAMLQTETGREQFGKLNDSEVGVTLNLSKEENIRKNAKGQTVARFGGTKITGYEENSDGTYSASSATITIYQGSIERITNKDKTYKSEKFNLMKQAGTTGSIGSVAGHETEHAVNQTNVNMNLQNQLRGKKHNIETGPKAITLKILRDAIKK